MMNNIVLMGRLTRDPEIRYTQSNTPVANVTLAVGRDIVRDGQRETDFIECVAWKSTAEFIAKHFVKGEMVALNGRLQIRDWTDREGNKRKAAEVVINNVYFCGSKSKTGNAFSDMEDDDGELPWRD